MSDRPHFSATQARMWLTCPTRYEFRYVKGEKRPPGFAQVQGSSWHAGAEAADREKMQTGQTAPLSLVTDAAAQAWKERCQTDQPDLDGQSPGALLDEVIGWSKLYHGEVAPRIRPEAVEEKFTLDRGAYDLVGRVDLLDAGSLVDRKSAGKTPPQSDADQSLQLGLYGAAVGPRPARLDVVVKLKKPKVEQFETAVREERIRRALAVADKIWAAIQTGVFPPNPEGWHCSQKWCGYWDICPYR